MSKKKQKPPPLRKHKFVTDHALVQWLRRVHGIDVDRLKDLMLTDAQRDILKSGATGICTNGCVYHIKDSKVVTVTLKKSKAAH